MEPESSLPYSKGPAAFKRKEKGRKEGQITKQFHDQSDEKYYDASSHENVSDLELIPTTSHFKERAWKNSQSEKLAQEGAKIKFSQDKKQHIKEKLEDGKLVYSGKFSYNETDIIVHSTGILLTTNQDNFVARVRVSNQVRLDFTKPFTDVKRKLYEKLVITAVLNDELLNERNEFYSGFKKLIQCRSGRSADDLECAEDLLQLSIILKEYRKLNVEYLDISILAGIANNKHISVELKNVTQDLLSKEKDLRERNKSFPKFDDSVQQVNIESLLGGLQEICNEGIEHHRKSYVINAIPTFTKLS
jgi:preprotein translocase subunit SecA